MYTHTMLASYYWNVAWDWLCTIQIVMIYLIKLEFLLNADSVPRATRKFDIS